MKHIKLMNKVLDNAKLLMIEKNRTRMSAIVVNNSGKIISIGNNNYYKTHPIQKHFAIKSGYSEYASYLHAEISALVKCRKKPYAIYVGRVLKNDKTAYAKPCPICMRAIAESGIKKIYYTNNNEEISEIIL
jgi:tRNA(Arg) A34 adenosine deaminase TadA